MVKKFIYYDYPATYNPNTSLPEQLILFFTDLHPVNSLQDGRDYVTRLNLVDQKMDQILDGLRRREAAGLKPPDFAIQWELYRVTSKSYLLPCHPNAFL